MKNKPSLVNRIAYSLAFQYAKGWKISTNTQYSLAELEQQAADWAKANQNSFVSDANKIVKDYDKMG